MHESSDDNRETAYDGSGNRKTRLFDDTNEKLYQKWDYDCNWNDISDVGWQTYAMNIQAVEPSQWEIGYCLRSWTGGAGGIHSYSRFFFGWNSLGEYGDSYANYIRITGYP